MSTSNSEGEIVCDERAERHLFSNCALLWVTIRTLILIIPDDDNEFKISSGSVIKYLK